MNKSVLFLSTLIIIAFCSSSRVISYDSVISKLVELNQAVGHDSSDIGVLVSKVSEAVKETQDKWDSFMSTLNQGGNAGSALLNEFIAKLQADITSAQAALDNATESNVSVTADIQKQNEDLNAAQVGLDGLKAQIAKEIEAFKTFGAEAEEKLVIIKSLRDIITDELLAPGSATSSFVQLKTFNSKLAQLKSLLAKSHDNTYSPLISTLLSLAQGQGFSDQGILSQILQVLDKLANNLQTFRDNQNDNGKKNIENLKARAEEIINEIKSFIAMISQSNAQLELNEQIIKTSTEDMESINKELARKTEELSYWQKTIQYQNELDANMKVGNDAVVTTLSNVNANIIGA